MPPTPSLISPVVFSHLFEKPHVSADASSFHEQVSTEAFLKHFIVSGKCVPSSSQDSTKRTQALGTMILLRLLQHKCPSLYQHSLRVRHFSQILAQRLLLSPEEEASIESAALLHDIGKILLPNALLDKPTSLTQEEFEQVKQHSVSGARLLSWIRMPDLITTQVYHHHERWNGSGYPDGLVGEAIPLGARIIALSDAFDVMTSYRPYQVTRTPLQALEELQCCSGEHFDPLLVNHFFHHLSTVDMHPFCNQAVLKDETRLFC